MLRKEVLFKISLIAFSIGSSITSQMFVCFFPIGLFLIGIILLERNRYRNIFIIGVLGLFLLQALAIYCRFYVPHLYLLMLMVLDSFILLLLYISTRCSLLE